MVALAGGPKKKAKKVRVRCLGPSPRKGEHFFLSADPTRERICRVCRLRMAKLDIGATWTKTPLAHRLDGRNPPVGDERGPE